MGFPNTNENSALIQPAEAASSSLAVNYGTDVNTLPSSVFLESIISHLISILNNAKTSVYITESTYIANIHQALINLKIQPMDSTYQQCQEAGVIAYKTLLGQLHDMANSGLNAPFKKALNTVIEKIKLYVQACQPSLYQASHNRTASLHGINPLLNIEEASAPLLAQRPMQEATAFFNPFFLEKILAELEQGKNLIDKRFANLAHGEYINLTEQLRQFRTDETHPENIMGLLHQIKNIMNAIKNDEERRTHERSFLRALDRLYDAIEAYAMQASPAFAKAHTEILDTLATAGHFITKTQCAGITCAILTPFSWLYCGWCCDIALICRNGNDGASCPWNLETDQIRDDHSLAKAGNEREDVPIVTASSMSLKKKNQNDSYWDYTTGRRYQVGVKQVEPANCGCMTNAALFFKSAAVVKESYKKAVEASYVR